MNTERTYRDWCQAWVRLAQVSTIHSGEDVAAAVCAMAASYLQGHSAPVEIRSLTAEHLAIVWHDHSHFVSRGVAHRTTNRSDYYEAHHVQPQPHPKPGPGRD